MRTRNQIWALQKLFSLATSIGLVSLVVAGPFTAGTSQAAKPPFLILVAGDSYSAGNGAGSYSGPTACRRSAFNYAQVFAATLRKAPYNQPTLVENTACSGDTTQAFDVSRRSSKKIPIFNTNFRRPQIEAFNRGYHLVFSLSEATTFILKIS